MLQSVELLLDPALDTAELLQVLPTGIGPEGIKINSSRGLMAVANETAETGVPSLVTLYSARVDGPDYPQLVSDTDAAGAPIPWVAMSGLAGDLDDEDLLYGVSDSFLATGYIYPIDVDGRPAHHRPDRGHRSRRVGRARRPVSRPRGHRGRARRRLLAGLGG